jgi:hypothetical protein
LQQGRIDGTSNGFSDEELSMNAPATREAPALKKHAPRVHDNAIVCVNECKLAWANNLMEKHK